jgi:DNA-binding transcriptional LysR family regulator
MRSVNEYLRTTPFDLYELHLFQLVVRHGSFTKAARVVGLTQSAITRQIQGIELALGLPLLERTTRTVRATAAGSFLYQDSLRLLGDVEQSLQRLREDYAGAKKVVRVGISRSIGLAHLPGFFHANFRRLPQVGCRVSCRPSGEILSALEANELELGVLCPPRRLSRTLTIRHRFADAFTLIGSAETAAEFSNLPKSRTARLKWAGKQNWLLIDEGSNTGQQLRQWMVRQGCVVEPGMQLDGFDLIINLVALGMGVSFVPIRTLALYGQKRHLRRLPWPERFERELAVVVRRNRQLPPHLDQFVENVLF